DPEPGPREGNGFLEPTAPAARAAAASPHAAPLGPGGRRGRRFAREDGAGADPSIPPVPAKVPGRLAPAAVAGRWSSAVRVIPPPGAARPDEGEPDGEP